MTDVFAMVRQTNKSLEVVVHDHSFTKTRVIMGLNDDELSLDDGRFKGFTRFQKYHYKTSVLIDITNSTSLISEKIDWIYEFTNYKWSLSVIPEKLWVDIFSESKPRVRPRATGNYNLDFIFSFENKIDAGYFALRWR